MSKTQEKKYVPTAQDMRHKQFSEEELSSIILKHLKEICLVSLAYISSQASKEETSWLNDAIS
jgi:hypothetical protein